MDEAAFTAARRASWTRLACMLSVVNVQHTHDDAFDLQVPASQVDCTDSGTLLMCHSQAMASPRAAFLGIGRWTFNIADFDLPTASSRRAHGRCALSSSTLPVISLLLDSADVDADVRAAGARLHALFCAVGSAETRRRRECVCAANGNAEVAA